MESFVNKALAYLGLKDIDDDEDLYAEEYEPEYDQGAHRNGHTVYPDREPEPAYEPRATTGGIRPVVSQDLHANPSTGRSAIVRPLVPPARSTAAQVHDVSPSRFADATEIGDYVRQSVPVIVNLTMSDRDLARRMIDFCSGLTYALNGDMKKVADQVFLLTPSNVEVSLEERQRLQERGLYQP